MRLLVTSTRLLACAAILIAAAQTCSAAFTPVWFDGYDATIGNDINVDLGPGRQGGSPIPLAYDTNFAGPSQDLDYHQQIVGDPAGNRFLQLAGDVNINALNPNQQQFHAYASPDNNFDGVVGGEVIGKRITVTVDATTNFFQLPQGEPGVNFDGIFTQAAVTIGSSEKLADSGNKLSGFSVIFIEQTFDEGLPENFIQIRDAGDPPSDPIGNLIPNPAGFGPANLEFLIDDATDGNPWDGIGQTDIEVLVNGSTIFNYTKGGGGYIDNYITLDGSNQKNVSLDTLAIHLFDNLTVFSAPIPEPATAGLLAVAVCGFTMRRKSC